MFNVSEGSCLEITYFVPYLTKAYNTRVVKTVVPVNINIIAVKITSFLSISMGLDFIQNLCVDLKVIKIPTQFSVPKRLSCTTILSAILST